MSANSSSEWGRIDALLTKYRRTPMPAGFRVVVENGDDAAVLSTIDAPVVSVDCAVEGVHFRLDFAPLDVLARRAFRAAASDLAAMGAVPVAALSALVLPEDFGDDALSLLSDGFVRAADELGMPIVGGNLSSGAHLSLTTTVFGEGSHGTLTRSAAQAGDGLFVTGTVGQAALALDDLLSGRGDPTGAWSHRPCRVEEGRSLVGHATAAIDVSDGLVQDAGQLAVASRASITIHADQVPVGAGPLIPALTGGDDYELLFTMPPDTAPPVPATKIGHVAELAAGAGRVDVWSKGARLSLPKELGYSHF